MKSPQEIVTELFVATDEREWQTVKRVFTENVKLDYSSLNGIPAITLTPNQIVSSWKDVLTGFTNTHHQLGNFLVSVKNKTASVKVYGTASHFLKQAKDNLWTVVGTYTFKLVQENMHWKVAEMTFHYKYQTGNVELINEAKSHN